MMMYQQHEAEPPPRTGVVDAMPRRLVNVLSGASVGCILLLTLVPTGNRSGILHLNPVSDLRHFVADPPMALLQLGGNVVLFLPFGFFLPLSVRWLDRPVRVTLCGASLSISVEAAQYVLPAGRYASTADVILNTVGAACGFLLMRALRGEARE